MAKYLVDTNVLIGVLRGDTKLSSFIDDRDCSINTTVNVELIQGAKNKSEVEKLEIALTEYQLVHFNEAISRRTISLIRTYSKSHGLLLADAIIAATCLEEGLELMTLNAQDFRFIKGLRLLVPKKMKSD